MHWQRYRLLLQLLLVCPLIIGCTIQETLSTPVVELQTTSASNTAVSFASPTPPRSLTNTSTVTPLPTASRTRRPSSTPIPTPTPTPTEIPTSTANFAPPEVKFTTSPAARCPASNPNVVLDLSGFEYLASLFPDPKQVSDWSVGYELAVEDIDEEINQAFDQVKMELIRYLSTGGSISNLQRIFRQQASQPSPMFYGRTLSADVTGDRVPEMFIWLAMPLPEQALPSPLAVDESKRIFSQPVQKAKVYIFACDSGQYAHLTTLTGWPEEVDLPVIADLNVDGVSEIIRLAYSFAGPRSYTLISVMEWDGNQFAELLHGEMGEDYLSSFMFTFLGEGVLSVPYGSLILEDIDRNGTKEIVVSGGLDFGQRYSLIYRETKIVLMWDGHGFTGFYWRAPAKYRIQAVWDGDYLGVRGFFKDALASYSHAINDRTLLTWSPEYNNLVWPLCQNCQRATPIPTNPKLDENEPIRLAAYALYRSILVHILLADDANALTTYQQLQEGYSQGAGASYAELGRVFWDAYLLDGTIGSGCAAAVAYVEAHRAETIEPLMEEAYGQSITYYYFSEALCPYK